MQPGKPDLLDDKIDNAASGAEFTAKVIAVANRSFGAVVGRVRKNLGPHHAYEASLIFLVQKYQRKVDGMTSME